MISERSRDTEEVMTAENSALHHRNKLHVKIYSSRKKYLNCNNISQYYCFHSKCRLDEHKRLLSKLFLIKFKLSDCCVDIIVYINCLHKYIYIYIIIYSKMVVS